MEINEERFPSTVLGFQCTGLMLLTGDHKGVVPHLCGALPRPRTPPFGIWVCIAGTENSGPGYWRGEGRLGPAPMEENAPGGKMAAGGEYPIRDNSHSLECRLILPGQGEL